MYPFHTHSCTKLEGMIGAEFNGVDQDVAKRCERTGMSYSPRLYGNRCKILQLVPVFLQVAYLADRYSRSIDTAEMQISLLDKE